MNKPTKIKATFPLHPNEKAKIIHLKDGTVAVITRKSK